MSIKNPNHVHLCGGTLNETTFGTWFGDLLDCRPISLPGRGHTPYVKLRFSGGLSLELTPAMVAELSRRLPESLAGFPNATDCSGAAWAGGDE